MNPHRPHCREWDQETWAAWAALLAESTPPFDADAALRGIECRIRQRRVRRLAAAAACLLLPCGVLLAMYLGSMQRPQPKGSTIGSASDGTPSTGEVVAAEAAPPGSPLRPGRGGPTATASNRAGLNDSPPAVLHAPWEDDWEQRLAEAQEMLLSVEQSWRRAPDRAAALKVKLDGLEADMAESTL
jgi:hypothetical protein